MMKSENDIIILDDKRLVILGNSERYSPKLMSSSFQQNKIPEEH